MGLDTVEIVLRTEEIFAIDLPDNECESIRTVSDLYMLVLKRLNLSYVPASEIEENALGRSRLTLQIGNMEEWTPPDVWQTLKVILEDQLQIDSAEIIESARFSEDLRCD